tara:strand:- start:293 stop:850 length:558 start_codon:yes stop_codon:yes gene_type:complete
MNDNTKIISALKEEWDDTCHPNLYISGCGKVNATICTMNIIKEAKINNLKINTIINYGTAGSTTGVKGLVDCATFYQRDMDATPLGFKIGETPFEDIPVKLDYSHIKNPINKQLSCGTGDSFVTSEKGINTDIVDMEAYAIAKVCFIHKINFISFKYITDDGSPDDWRLNCRSGIKLFKKILKNY